ncbi:hypothetical protein BKA66DRAFT_439112 [Pyrenochaeta sp. MPI-SDFR-AT-0127]|nr:hypothetical protein BKA66DRAFT_439112 [Pyrenochaeta sp. MPI-SDFR-AT-0127]
MDDWEHIVSLLPRSWGIHIRAHRKRLVANQSIVQAQYLPRYVQLIEFADHGLRNQFCTSMDEREFAFGLNTVPMLATAHLYGISPYHELVPVEVTVFRECNPITTKVRVDEDNLPLPGVLEAKYEVTPHPVEIKVTARPVAIITHRYSPHRFQVHLKCHRVTYFFRTLRHYASTIPSDSNKQLHIGQSCGHVGFDDYLGIELDQWQS